VLSVINVRPAEYIWYGCMQVQKLDKRTEPCIWKHHLPYYSLKNIEQGITKTELSQGLCVISNACHWTSGPQYDFGTMAPALSSATQVAIIASAFLVPVLTYIYFTRSQQPKSSAGPLPSSTEITALYIHPIKSCHGISVQSAKLLPTGLDLGKVKI
jgi:hypothetical protein